MLNLKLPGAVFHQLAEIARTRNTTVPTLIRGVLREFVNNHSVNEGQQDDNEREK